MRHIPLLSVLLFSFLLSTLAQAQTPSVEAYASLPAKTKFKISPNGQLVAYRDNSKNQDALVVINMATKKLVSALNLASIKPHRFYFITDNNLILVASQHLTLPGYIGQHNVTIAYSYNLKTKKLHQMLTPGNGIYDGQLNLGTILGVSADNKYAYMPAYHNEVIYNLYRVRLDKKSKPRIYQKGTEDTEDFFLGNDKKVIARERFSNKRNLHRIESKLSGKWVTVFEENTEIRTKGFTGLTPDKKSLVMITLDQQTGRDAFYTLSLEDGKIAGPLFSQADKDVEGTLKSIDRVVHGVRYSGFQPSYEFFDEKLNSRIRGIQKALPNMGVKITDYTDDWKSIIIHSVGDKNPGEYLLYSNKQLDFLAAVRPNIPNAQMHDVIEYTYTTRDGLTIPTLLTIPNGKEVNNLPAIMMPHGGPESYDIKGFHYRAQYFASQGYLVIQPQFRGSEGFGLNHLLAGRGEWGRKMQDDLTDAVNTLSKEGKINKDRVCIVGGSYGGYAALAGAAFTPDVYKCVVSINGLSDIQSMMKDEKWDHGSDHWVVAYWEKVIARGGFDKNHLYSISPINFIDNIKAPILLIHGENDKVVPMSQSKRMAKKLKKAQKEVTYIQLHDGDHYLSTAKNRMKAMQEIAKFVKEHI